MNQYLLLILIFPAAVALQCFLVYVGICLSGDPD